jgi:hypothetical protein
LTAAGRAAQIPSVAASVAPIDRFDVVPVRIEDERGVIVRAS